MECSHSPFGFVWQIASETGWSARHILWRVSYATLIMMLNDAPRYMSVDELKKQNRKFKKNKISSLEAFQTRLQ